MSDGPCVRVAPRSGALGGACLAAFDNEMR